MEKGRFHGPVGKNMLETISMIKRKGMENFIGQMEGFSKGNGEMGGSMEKGVSSQLKI